MNCVRCEALTPTGMTLCHTDTERLETVLDEIPEAIRTAGVTIARLDRIGGGGKGGGGSKPEAVNIAALDTKIDLDEKLMSWSRLLLEDDDPQMARVAPIVYLRMSVTLIRTKDYAGDLLDELEACLRQLQRAVDLPQERFAYGKCGEAVEGFICAEPITAAPDAEWAACRACGAAHDLTARSDEMRKKAKGELMPAAEVRRYLASKTRAHVKAKDFENWVYHGLLGYVLETVGYGGERRLYYPGDVFKIHHHMQTRKRVAA